MNSLNYILSRYNIYDCSSLSLKVRRTLKDEKEMTKYFGTFKESSITPSHDLYLEALVYGKISPSDIDSFLVLNEEIGRRLPNMGIPIHYMEIERTKGRFIFSKGKRLK